MSLVIDSSPVLFSLVVPSNSTTTKDRGLLLWLPFAKSISFAFRVLQVPHQKSRQQVLRLYKYAPDSWTYALPGVVTLSRRTPILSR
jgi:hypothetical protein